MRMRADRMERRQRRSDWFGPSSRGSDGKSWILPEGFAHGLDVGYSRQTKLKVDPIFLD